MNDIQALRADLEAICTSTGPRGLRALMAKTPDDGLVALCNRLARGSSMLEYVCEGTFRRGDRTLEEVILRDQHRHLFSRADLEVAVWNLRQGLERVAGLVANG